VADTAGTRARDEEARQRDANHLRVAMISAERLPERRQKETQRRIGEAELKLSVDRQALAVKRRLAPVDVRVAQRIRVLPGQQRSHAVALEHVDVDKWIWIAANHPHAEVHVEGAEQPGHEPSEPRTSGETRSAEHRRERYDA
jgi:hypothetical protein